MKDDTKDVLVKSIDVLDNDCAAPVNSNSLHRCELEVFF
jgi:hypothetical protein